MPSRKRRSRREEKTYGVLLLLWLILMLFANLGSAATYIFLGRAMTLFYPTAPPYIFTVLALLSLVNVVITIFLFLWKKWAFYAFCGMAVIAFFLNIIMGLGPWALMGFLGPAILYALLRPKWHLLENR